MTKAENFSALLEGARNGTEFSRALGTATRESIAEEWNEAGKLEALEFADGSRRDMRKVQS